MTPSTADSSLTFDHSLSTALAPVAVDFPEASFFRVRNETQKPPELPTPAEVRSRRDGAPSGTVAFPEIGLFVKFGARHRASLEEAQTLQAIRRAFPNNEVPVPELFGWRMEDGINYIYMSFITGSTLHSAWPTLTLPERTDLADQLAQITAALRSVRQPFGQEYIGALDHGPVQAVYFRGHTVGPFPDAKEFHDALQFYSLHWQPLSQRPPDPFRHMLSDTTEIRFSHGDLHLHNIMVTQMPNSRCVVNIVDWGQAGWYPEYWEHFNMERATWDHEWAQQGWLSRVLGPPHDSEAEALANYWSWRGPP